MKEELLAPSDEEIDKFYARIDKECKQTGYRLNPDQQFVKSLIRGILTNERRYGYASCPCRLAADNKEQDLDIICPCYYRDPDLSEFGACYCALYVSEDVIAGKRALSSVPERRPAPEDRVEPWKKAPVSSALPVPVWRCLVCGYLCGREEPPEVCPICKARKERFERFM